jgi:hypothetical protein
LKLPNTLFGLHRDMMVAEIEIFNEQLKPDEKKVRKEIAIVATAHYLAGACSPCFAPARLGERRN